MKATKLKKLLESFLKYQEKSDKWINSIPSEIVSGFFDNPYANSKEFQIELLISFIFDDLNLTDDVMYFLYDGFPKSIEIIPGEKYEINDVNDFINYVVAEKLIEDDR